MPDAPSRDLIGYAGRPPDPDWPGGARIALNFVLNYEEGAEYCLLNGDAFPETSLSDLSGLEPLPGTRHLNIESAYEYGSRVGFWRILRVFQERGLPFTINAVGLALEQNPRAAEAIAVADADVQSHAWRWIDYQFVGEAEEREHIRKCVETIERLTGARPLGWYSGRPSLNTRRLVVEEGGFLYDSDAYNDDLPYWNCDHGRPHLVIPYSLDANDSRFTRAQGFNRADDFFSYVKDAFDCLYAEGEHAGKMLSVGLHCRLVGRAGRIAGLTRFLDHVQRHDRVWICKRLEIARHWIARHPYTAAAPP